MAETSKSKKEHTLLLERMVDDFGIKKKQAEEYLVRYEAEYITANLDLVEKRHEQGAVKYITAYAVKALLNDYRTKMAIEAKEKQAEKEALVQKQANLEEEYESVRVQKIEDAMSMIGKDVIREEYSNHITKLAQEKPFYQKFVMMPDEKLASYLEDKGKRAMFNTYVVETFCHEDYHSLEAWQLSNFKT